MFTLLAQDEIAHSPKEPAEYRQCKALWRAVVMQAIIDLRTQSDKYLKDIHRKKAILWINMSNKDFIRVCELADIEPQTVYDYKLYLMKKLNL